jgi:hypothetical protein
VCRRIILKKLLWAVSLLDLCDNALKGLEMKQRSSIRFVYEEHPQIKFAAKIKHCLEAVDVCGEPVDLIDYEENSA